MSDVICIRLNAAEIAQLDELVDKSETGFENRTEVFRLLLAREVNRRKGLPKPAATQWRSVFRPVNGKPVRTGVPRLYHPEIQPA